jgi:rhodanese-related sulfurtransferase
MTRIHDALIGAAVVLAAAAAAADTTPISAGVALADIAHERDHITAVELAEQIIARHPPRILDLRSDAEFRAFHIPTAEHASLESLAALNLPRTEPVVLYSEGAPHAAQAWVLLRMRGLERVSFLREGLYEWIALVQEPRLAIDATAAERTDFDRRAAMSHYFGGQPHVDVPRSELPVGYWSAGEPARGTATPTTSLVASIRRRGC